MKGKLIVIEGTDCSGKETQSKLLVERLEKEGKKVVRVSFPMYDTPTGAIVGACVLGKPHMCEELLKENHGFFKEGGGNIDELAALCYYAADRRYNLPIINKYLEEGYIVIADRYVTSNMAHRGGLIKDKEKRLEIYKKIEKLEYEIMELTKPDKTILLYMPYEQACVLKQKRGEAPDEVESNEEYLRLGEKAYLELADLYGYSIVNCSLDGNIRSIEEIHKDVYDVVVNK